MRRLFYTFAAAALSIEIDTLEQHQTEKIDTEVKDIEDMIGYESQKCMHPVHGAAFWGVIRALQSDINLFYPPPPQSSSPTKK